MKRPILLLTFLLFTILLFSACQQKSQPKKTRSNKEIGQETLLKVAISKKALTLTSLMAIAGEQGYFKQNGLRIEKVPVGTVQSLINKQADVAMTAAIPALSNFLNNKNVKFLAAIENFDSAFDASNRFLVSRFPKKELKSIKVIGIQKKALNDRLLIKILLKKIGVDNRQVRYIEVPSEADRVVMLAKAEIDLAFLGSAKTVSRLKSEEGFTLFDSHRLFKGYNSPNGIISTGYAIEQKPEAIKGFVKAIYKALQYTGENKEATIAYFQKNGLSKTKAASLYEDINNSNTGLDYVPGKNISQIIQSILITARHFNPQRNPEEFIFKDYAAEAVDPRKEINRI